MIYSYIKIIVCTKNEYDLIEPFIIFYGSLFGFENVIIVDNNSTDERVLKIYEKYKEKGLEIIVDKRQFTEIIPIMTENINRLKDKCEWLFVLETDEFIFLFENAFDKESILDKNKIIEYLKSQSNDVSIIRYRNVWNSCIDVKDKYYKDYKYSCPPVQITKFKRLNWEKNIIRTKKFKNIDLWSHWIIPIDGETIVTDTIGLLHYHNTGIKRYHERNINLIKGYNYYDINNINIYIEICICNYLIKQDVQSNHRIKEYLKFIYRKFIIEHFTVFISRLPTISEINELIKIENYQNLIEYLLLNRNRYIYNKNNENKNILELIYHEETMDYEYEVYQVKNYLKPLLKDYGIKY